MKMDPEISNSFRPSSTSMSGDPWIIAEIGVNHDGKISQAKALIDVSAEAGADAVKIQTYETDLLVTKFAKKAPYQSRASGHSESQWAMLKGLQLSHQKQKELRSYAAELGIEFLSTPFDPTSLRFLATELELKSVKIASSDLTNLPLLVEAATLFETVFLSTGMSTLGEVESALAALAFGFSNGCEETPSRQGIDEALSSISGQQELQARVCLLHCTSDYPARLEDSNLQAVRVLHEAFGCQVGFSDHTTDSFASVAALALGATVFEKHVTLDKDSKGPDHRASLEPEEFGDFTKVLRQTYSSLRSPMKRPVEAELENRKAARKSLVAAQRIREGEKFSTDNLVIMRPGGGISPMGYWEFVGRISSRAYSKGELIDE